MKKFLCVLMALLTVFALTGCGDKFIETPEDIEGKRIAVLKGSSSVIYAEVYGGSVRVCETKKELLNAVKLRDVDCALVDETDEGRVTRMQWGIKTLNEPIEAGLRIAAAYENPDLISDINAAILYLQEEGVIRKITKGYYKNKEEFVFEHTEVSEDAKTLTVGVCVQDGPFCYLDENGELRGIEIDLAIEICAYLGLKCEFEIMDQDDLIDAARGGTVHFAMGCITDTSENADKCIMSEPYAECTQIILIDR